MSTNKDKNKETPEQDEYYFGFDEEDGLEIPQCGIAMRIAFLIILIAIAGLIIFGLVELALWLKMNT